MSWEAVGAIAELLGAIAILATIIYLAIQVRQAGSQLRSSSTQTATQRLYDRALLVAQNKELADLIARASSGNEDFDATETTRIMSYVAAVMVDAEESYRQYSMGNINYEEFEERGVNAARHISESPPGRAAWEFRSAQRNPGFRDWRNNKLPKGGK